MWLYTLHQLGKFSNSSGQYVNIQQKYKSNHIYPIFKKAADLNCSPDMYNGGWPRGRKNTI